MLTIIVTTSIFKTLLIIVPLLIAVAYFTLFERKVIGSMQGRRGPNVVGFFGLLQPLADGLKLFLKETVLPSSANLATYIAAPIITFILSLLGWAVIPFDENMIFADINISILYIFAVSSLGVYGILLSG
jgi:NADH-quinone oxidoreductase subunit H